MDDKEVALQCTQCELNQLTKQIEENDRKYHSLRQSREREQDLYAEKANYIDKMCQALNITVDFDIRNCNDRAGDLVVGIRNSLGQVNTKIKEIIANNEKLDAEHEKAIQVHREDKTRIESEIKSIAQQLLVSEESLAHQREELRKAELSNKLLEETSSRISNIQAAKQQLNEQKAARNIRGKIDEHRAEKQTKGDELDEVDGQITAISKFATLLAQVNSKEQHIEKRESEIRRIKNKHFDNFQKLFANETIETGIKRKIEQLNVSLRCTVNKLEAEVRRHERQVDDRKNQLQNKKQELNVHEDELRKLEEEIDKECEQLPFVEVLASAKELSEKYQMEFSTLKSSDIFYKK